MIDIHCHILPGLDDGARDLPESLEMARIAVKSGIRVSVATPHMASGGYIISRSDIMNRCTLLNNALRAESIPLIVLPGAEVRLTPDILKDFDTGRLMTLNDDGHSLLIELPDLYIVDAVMRILREFRTRGVQVILAHPERNHTIQRKPHHLIDLGFTGALCQLTAGSLSGLFGKRVQEFAEGLLAANVIQFLASDAHDANRRTPNLSMAFSPLKRIVGEKTADEMVFENPETLLDIKRLQKKDRRRINSA